MNIFESLKKYTDVLADKAKYTIEISREGMKQLLSCLYEKKQTTLLNYDEAKTNFNEVDIVIVQNENYDAIPNNHEFQIVTKATEKEVKVKVKKEAKEKKSTKKTEKKSIK